MKWIHFSDIHFNTPSAGCATEQLRDDLVEYLTQHSITADYLFFTGDYRYAPAKTTEEEAVRLAASYIRQLAKAVGINDDDRIILVPGNHDLKRIKGEAVTHIRADYNVERGDFSVRDLNKLSRRFSFFQCLEKEIHPSHSPWYNGTDFYLHTSLNIGEVSLLLLNTAITCNDNEERGKLVIGNLALYSTLKAVKQNYPEQPIVVLAHHALDMFSIDESKRVEGLLRKLNVCLYLCGDAHKIWYRPIGNNTLELTMGCIFSPDNSGYQAVFSCGEITNGRITALQAYQWDTRLMEWGEYSQFNQSILCYLLMRNNAPQAPILSDNIDIIVDPDFEQYMNDQMDIYAQRNIAIQTPQLLSMALRYPNNIALKILNDCGDNYGDDLLKRIEMVDQHNIENGRTFQERQREAFQNLMKKGIEMNKDYYKYFDFVSSCAFCYFILEYSEGSTAKMIRNELGDRYETAIHCMKRGVRPSIPASVVEIIQIDK